MTLFFIFWSAYYIFSSFRASFLRISVKFVKQSNRFILLVSWMNALHFHINFLTFTNSLTLNDGVIGPIFKRLNLEHMVCDNFLRQFQNIAIIRLRQINHQQNCIQLYIQQMPIREGKAKLWFNTKEEQDQFDDKMISSIRVQSSNYEDENYTPIFVRKRQEFFLELSDTAINEIRRISPQNNLSEYIDKYHSGKRDHTFWREWTFEKIGFGYAFTYLLLREVPIRNFYARAWLMFFFFGKMADTLLKGFYFVPDQFTDKAIKNYGVYKTMMGNTPPTLDGKLPEEALWKMNQPGYLRNAPQKFLNSAFPAVFIDKPPRTVEWDGTFNMPLEGLASPKHKDAKFIDFIYQ